MEGGLVTQGLSGRDDRIAVFGSGAERGTRAFPPRPSGRMGAIHLGSSASVGVIDPVTPDPVLATQDLALLFDGAPL